MFLAVDIGNSNIVISIYDGEHWLNTYRYESKEEQPTLYYINGLSELLLEWGVTPADIGIAAISSVVPRLNDRISEAIAVVIGQIPHILGPEDFMSVDMHVPKVYEIGSDLVANSYAAITKHETDSLIIDFGTALTFTVVTKEHGIRGVSIAPGLKTAMEALSGNTAQLPEVWLSWPESALGHSTEEAIKAGVLVGYYGLVSEMRKQILAEYPAVKTTIGTGGLVTVIDPLQEQFDIIDKNLTLDGIRLIANRRLQDSDAV